MRAIGGLRTLGRPCVRTLSVLTSSSLKMGWDSLLRHEAPKAADQETPEIILSRKLKPVFDRKSLDSRMDYVESLCDGDSFPLSVPESQTKVCT